jgi:putative transposase
LLHVRTRHRWPQPNGVVERCYQAITYEHLYRHEIGDGLVLAREVESDLTVSNTIRPHEAIGFTTPLARYLQAPSTPPRPTFTHPQPSQILDTGHTPR